MTKAGSPDPRNDRICITSSCPRQFDIGPSRLCRYQQPSRLLEAFAAYHHGPGHPCDLVGQRNGSDLDRPAFHDTHEPESFRAVLPRISDDRRGSSDEQPSQISIALL